MPSPDEGGIFVLPTHVGMSLGTDNLNNLSTRAPHTRGDEPYEDVGKEVSVECSPHTWG